MSSARDIKQQLGRARVAVRGSDLLKALEALIAGLELHGRTRLIGQEKYEVEGLLNEVLHGFGTLPTVTKLFPRGLVFRPAEAEALLSSLRKLQATILGAIEKAEYTKTLASVQDIDAQLSAASSLLEQEQHLEARKALRLLLQRHQDQPGLALYIGNMLLKHGQAADAEAYFRMAMEQDPKNPSPHAQMVTVQEMLGQWMQAEEAVTTVMRRFGAGEHEYARLAAILLRQGRATAAREAAASALKKNPQNKKAGEILQQLAPDHPNQGD
ncbi:MAG: tetratricopeptide repeat protein [Desulfovibrionales bacterium]